MKNEYIFKCEKCGKEYKLYLTINEYNKGRYRKCCSKQCSNSRVVSEKTKTKISESIKKRIENGVLTGIVNDPERFKKIPLILKKCRYCHKEFCPSKTTLRSYKYCSEECKQKYHKEVYLPKLGGYRKGSGHGKSGWYKGIYCDSSWELAFVIYYLEHNLNIKRCKEIRKYYYNNREYKYFPDFITDDGLIEIKGYSNEQWEAKQQQNTDVKTLYKSDIQLYLDYVIKKYGNNFVELYDNLNPSKSISNNIIMLIHRYDDVEKIYYTKVINPKDYEKHMTEGWVKGRGKFYEGYKKEHIKTNNVFKR